MNWKAEISRAETVIAQCETALQDFVSADESQRQSQELDQNKAAHAAFLKEWEELSPISTASRLNGPRLPRNRTPSSVISEDHLPLCDIRNWPKGRTSGGPKFQIHRRDGATGTRRAETKGRSHAPVLREFVRRKVHFSSLQP